MKIRIIISLPLTLLFYSISLSSFAYNNTEDYWQCLNRVGGEWNFGRIPYACDISPFGTETHVTNNYAPVVFDDNAASRNTERDRYMQELYAFIRDAADYYLLTRKPDASSDERSAWQHAIYSIAHQESFWSHYRDASDGRMKMIRGDSGHGHGMMQIDDRWHFTAIDEEGKGFKLIENMIYAQDIYYAEWQRAPDQWCLDSATNWRDRSRSAYSAYNGGPIKICRWTDPNDTWAQNDENFAQKYDNHSWDWYIADSNHVSSIHVSCLAEGGSNCNQPDFSAWDGRLLKIDNSDACIYSGNKLHCLDDDRNAVCLTHIADFDLALITELTSADIVGISRSDYNQHQICHDLVASLHRVGSFIHILQDIELLAAPGGGKIADIPTHSTIQVLDFQVEDKQDHDRHYMVTFDSQTGYINAGDKNDHNTWTEITTEIPTNQLIPVTGQTIRIVPGSGINLRETPGGTLITAVPNAEELIAQSYVVRDTDNKIYYELDYANQSGYIYGGHIFDPPTVENWVELVASENNSGQDSQDDDSEDLGTSSSGGGSTNIMFLFALCLTFGCYRKDRKY